MLLYINFKKVQVLYSKCTEIQVKSIATVWKFCHVLVLFISHNIEITDTMWRTVIIVIQWNVLLVQEILEECNTVPHYGLSSKLPRAQFSWTIIGCETTFGGADAPHMTQRIHCHWSKAKYHTTSSEVACPHPDWLHERNQYNIRQVVLVLWLISDELRNSSFTQFRSINTRWIASSMTWPWRFSPLWRSTWDHCPVSYPPSPSTTSPLHPSYSYLQSGL